ncbi:MAG: family 78 glycoside hydrolase catalytic domain [Prevotella sp.]|nr:family 78 glycoside hydrolase catalytic domain [Prevotella sp.]
MRRYLLILLALLPLAITAKKKAQTSDVSVTGLRVENLEKPLGIDTAEPRFSWIILSDKQNVKQTAYQIIVTTDKGEVWNSGKVESDQQLWVRYSGQLLKSTTQCSWKVKVWTTAGETDWSEEACFGIGLLKESHWSGRWIGLERLMPGEERGLHTRLAARYVRKEFELEKPIKRAIAYVAGIGLHELHINGVAYNTYVMQPMPTDYRKTVLYNTYDVTNSLKNKNCIGLVLGNGRVFPMRQNKPYKAPVFGLPKCRINLLIEFTDGTTTRISTDEKWKITANGPIRSNNEYDGEIYDARKEMAGWDMPNYNDEAWMNVERTEIPLGTLRAQMAPGMVMQPFTIAATNTGNIYDFHQNMAGWIGFIPTGKQGDTIRVKYAEKLNPDGTLYLDNFRDAQSEDIYICGQSANTQEWHPIFSYHGFRYAQITGPVKNVRAYTVSDDMQTLGHFECSNKTLNKIMNNAWWGIYSNYKGMPIDCPQRNERQPWLGDRTMGSLGESFMFNNERLYNKWMRDICESQREDGVFCDVAPAYWNYYNDDVTWPAALPFGCDMLYRQFGNREAIDNSYPYIKRWLEHLLDEYLKDGIITKDTYGDWCVPPEKLELIHSQDPTRKTDGSLISTAYVIRVLQLLEQWGCEANHWSPIRKQMTQDFNRHFLTIKEGTSPRPGHPLYPDSIFYGNNTATANLLALSFGLVPEKYQTEVVKNLVENIIVKNNGHVPCGVIGISWLLRGLSDNGFSDIAYMLATQKSYPSWGYMVENGATTIWELWNGDKASPRMNSGNHVMLLGDLITWCYQYLGGIRQITISEASQLAYKHIILRPDFNIQDCSYANVSYRTPYGTIISKWEKTLQHTEWDVQIPCNTTADIYLPDGRVEKVGSGKYHFSCTIPTAHPAITKDEFLYEQATFPQCHSASIVETKKGDLVATYFGGTHERNPDVCIYVSIKKKGEAEWSKPILAADGVFDNGRKACWNPVITEMPNGELWLFFKIGTKVADWTGWITKSKDGGKTWSPREALPNGFLGPVKNKPELINGRLLCPSSTEGDGWKFHVEIYDLKTKQWKYVGPIEAEMAMRTEDMPAISNFSVNSTKEDIEAPDAGGVADRNGMHPIDCIQPSILKLKDGRLQVLMRTRNGKIGTSYSSDQGNTWSKVKLLDVPNNQSGTDAVTLQDGRHVLIYNNFETLPATKKGVRTPLSIAISDDGISWRHALTLEDSPISQYSYPSIIQGKDGKLHVVYTWRRQRIAYKEIDIDKLR